VSERCSSGKYGFTFYGDALMALVDVDRREGRTSRGSVYECERCDQWHVSKRLFWVTKHRGRGRRSFTRGPRASSLPEPGPRTLSPPRWIVSGLPRPRLRPPARARSSSGRLGR
jgi:hypothetical protein